METIHTVRQTSHMHIYTTRSADGLSIFVKKALSPDGQIQNTREFHNQTFLHQYTQGTDVGFDFLMPTFDDTSLTYPDIRDTHEWLAQDGESVTTIATLDQYQKEMVTFLKWCLTVPHDAISPEMNIDSEERRGLIWSRFNTDAAYLEEHALLNTEQIEELRSNIEIHIDTRAFQHHDLVPWHMARHKQTGRLTLVDAGWSGWSFKYYDIAYYVLQIIGRTNNTTDALALWELAQVEFAYDTKYKETIAAPLSYRGVRFGAELHRQQKLDRTQQVISTMFTLLET